MPRVSKGLMSFEYQPTQFKAWYGLRYMFPEMNARLLGFIGHMGKLMMMKTMLSGQALTYRRGKGPDEWHDRSGKRKVSYRVMYRHYVKIASYPANFFSVGRRLRSGAHQAKLPIWRTLKAHINAESQSILDEFDRKYMQKIIMNYTDTPRTYDRY